MKTKLLLFVAFFISTSLCAVSVPIAPEKVGIQQQKINQVDKTVVDKKLKKATIDKLNVDKKVEGVGKNRIKGPSFILQNVSITGNTVFEQEVIIAVVKPFVGKSVDSLDLKYIAQKITNLYKKKGYVTSECIIPAQKVKDGKVIFQIIEDKLGGIILKGESKYNYDSNIFMKYLSELQGKIINEAQLNEKLKLLSYLPVTRVKPSLQKTRKGFTNLVLEIFENKEYVSIATDNGGSRYTGEQRVTVNGNINNIRGKSDVLSLSLTTGLNPKYLTSFSSSYTTPVGSSGGRLIFSFSYMDYQLNPDEVGSNLVIYDGSSTIFGLKYIAPLPWLTSENISYFYGMEKRNTTARTLQNSTGDVLVNGVDEIFSLNAGMSYSILDHIVSKDLAGATSVQISATKALEGVLGGMTQEDLQRKLDSNSSTFPINGPIKYGKGLNPSFLKIYYSLQRQQQIWKNTILSLYFGGDYTKDRVPDSFEYSGGDYGYSYNANVSHNFEHIGINFGVSQSKVFTRSFLGDGSTSSYENPVTMSFGLNSYYKGFYGSLSYYSAFDTWDSNANNLRYNIKYVW